MIGFGLSPFLAVHGGTTSDPDQLRTEIELTAAVGIAGPSTIKPQPAAASWTLIDRLTVRALTDCTCGCALALFGLVVYSATKDTARTPISTPDAPQPVQGAYSQAVSAGGFLYLAGQVGLGPVETADEFKAARRSIEEQTEIACQNVTAVLAAGGCKPKDLVKVTVFLADIGDFTRMNSVCESLRSFGCACPAEPRLNVAACVVQTRSISWMPGLRRRRGRRSRSMRCRWARWWRSRRWPPFRECTQALFGPFSVRMWC